MEMNVAENLPSKDGETSDNTMEKTPRQDVWNMADLEGMFRKVAETRKGREKLMKSYKRLRYIYHQLKERLEVEQEKKNTGQEKTGDSQVKADDVKLQEASVVTSRPNDNTDTTHLKEPCREQPTYDGKNQHLRSSATLHASTSSEGPHCLPKAGNIIPAHTEGRSYEITDEDSDAEDVLEHEPMITGESSAASDARNVAMPQSSVYRYVQGVNPGVVSLPNTDMIDVQSLYKSLGIQNVYTSESPNGSDTHHTQERGMSSSCFQGLNAQQPPKQGMSSFFAEASLNGSRSDPQMNPVASLDHGASVVAADTSKNELKKMLFPCTVCPICNKSFSAKSVLKKHLLIHSNTRPFKCGTCGNGFNSRSSLQTHERLHSGERPYACRYCELRFAVSSHRTTHERTHTKEQPYQCEFCSRRFSLSCSLQRHRRLHTGERPHKCSECGSDFKQKEHLKYHKAKYHTGEKLHKCTECSEAFVYAQQLKHHKARVHTGEMLYKCTYCSQAFSYPHQLRSHRAEVHMDETPYKCSHCGDAFNSCQERDDHRDKVHTGGNPYKCDDCVCVFYHPKELNHHRMQVHQDKTSLGQSDFPTDVDVDVD
ncbi:zinc finger protein 79-like isoform X1 [Haliotis rufescens]|uniref:zinc finger protein 79-like isoform X1 n=1 Tax=Haliotis rufescens TaxID=6454 RepID=UPI00201EF957|nr:zinc finger protein 79-like isoform X1 [Haliotis rufescens]